MEGSQRTRVPAVVQCTTVIGVRRGRRALHRKRGANGRSKPFMASLTISILAFGERCYSDRVPKTNAETSSRDAARERARLTKSGVAAASVVLFAIAIPAVRGTQQGHARTAHALKPPPSLVDAVARGGFRPGDLAPSQSAPVVQSSGS